jgi:aryl carrier-like protein
LVRIVAGILNRHSIGIRENLFDLGIDSILVIQIVSRARQVGLRLNPGQVFRHQTIADLARVAEQVETVEAEQGPVVGPVPLTPIQRWFFEQDLPAPHHFNQSLLLEMSPTPDPERLRRAVDSLTGTTTPSLRFTRTDSGWSGTAGRTDDRHTLRPRGPVGPAGVGQDPGPRGGGGPPPGEPGPGTGPLLRVALFDLGPDRPARLLLVVHHLVVDGVSWRILLEDLATVLGQLERGEEPVLPPKTTSFRQWAELCRGTPARRPWRASGDTGSPRGRDAVAPLPVDLGEGRDPGTVAEAAVLSTALDEEETRALLQEVPRAFHSQINDALLAALAGSLAGWTGRGTSCSTSRGTAGGDRRRRGPVADGRLVHDDLPRPPGPARRPRPGRGAAIGQGAATPHPPARGRVRPAPPPPGRPGRRGSAAVRPRGRSRLQLSRPARSGPPASSGLAPARESAGPARAPEGRRTHLLDLLGFVVGGRLRFDWTYNPRVHRRETIEGLADAFRGSCGRSWNSPVPGGARLYPSDFPLAGLDQATLDHVFAGERGIEDIYPLSPTQRGCSSTRLRPGVGCLRPAVDLHPPRRPRPFGLPGAWRTGRRPGIPALRTSFHWVESDRPCRWSLARSNPLEEFDWAASRRRCGRAGSPGLSADRERGFVASWAPLCAWTLDPDGGRVAQFWSSPIIT